MKRKTLVYAFVFITSLLLVSCAKDKSASDDALNTSKTEDQAKEEPMEDKDNKENDVVTVTPELAEETGTETPTEEPTPTVEPTPTEESKIGNSPDREATAKIEDVIPAKYLTLKHTEVGTIEHISYQTKDYFGDQSEITKYAYVYLPYNYDSTKQYKVLYLMHGIGGNEQEWGMYNSTSKVKVMMDNLIYYGDIEPFIIVAPNGRSGADFANTSSDHNAFYKFGQELRNELIPYIDEHYATYAEFNEAGYDLAASREHRAMAGLSMGAMQTINIGLSESLDLLSYFGAFSACPTTFTANQIADAMKNFADYDVNYFYNICGTEDGLSITHADNAVNNLTTLSDKFSDDNLMYQKVKGTHDFGVWYLGFYNFAQIVFK